jgi:hypothetical protein
MNCRMARNILWVLLLLAMLGCSPPPARNPDLAILPQTATPTPLTASVALDPVAKGHTQELDVRLLNPRGDLITLTLRLDYPSGVYRSIVRSTLSATAIISWTIPLDAGVGMAQYRLSASDCGCNGGFVRTTQDVVGSAVQGNFDVQ